MFFSLLMFVSGICYAYETVSPTFQEPILSFGMKIGLAFVCLLAAASTWFLIPKALTIAAANELMVTNRLLISAQEELLKRRHQIEKFNRFAIKREHRIIELKMLVNRLSEDLGKPMPFVESSLDENSEDSLPDQQPFENSAVIHARRFAR